MRRLIALAVLVAVAVVGYRALSSRAYSARAADGPFVLEISSPQSGYAAGEAIPISATLTYTGPEATVTVSHALQVIGFGVDGFLDGSVRPIFAFKCASTQLQRGESLTVGFAKTGATMTPDPSFDAFMADPMLRLPPGTWHVYADAEFSEGGCGQPGHQIRAEIVITVSGSAPM